MRRVDPAEARAAVAGALLAIVPDADVESLGDDTPFRGELDLDSLDFLTFVETVCARTGVRIDEADYPRLTTVASCVAFLSEP
ncbi:acyl carrier protein [Nocardioides sp. QY071]|uniref:acyl carrier protein n=1 Tax=Nocardioides sp. QY071 TaxID=3044187 RepID=UPI00249C70F9|nr:acyl carrier protein [Nocardioides sp. QY071]WGY04536.1 acyl carrier protein [Nocardioides sp. QY071]